MACYCVHKNLPCAFLIFTIHYTFPIDHTLDLITNNILQGLNIMTYYNLLPSCYTLPLGSKHSL
jgi:hypothetical protein